MSNLSDASHYGELQVPDGGPIDDVPKSPRPTLSRSSAKRPSSMFGSLRNYKLSADDDVPLSATSTRTSTWFGDFLGDEVRDRKVIHHGEVQTSSSMFRKKKEYLVLTETHLLRFKSQTKAAESFSA